MFMTPSQMAAACSRAVQASGVEVLLRWETVISGTLDATTGALVGGEVVQHSGTVRAFVHAISPASTALRHFEELEAGDMMFDFPPGVAIDGVSGLRFELAGETYVQKNLGGRAARHFDVLAGEVGTPTFRSVIARKAT